VSGGNGRTSSASWRRRAAKAGWDVRERGVAGEPGRRLRVYGFAGNAHVDSEGGGHRGARHRGRSDGSDGWNRSRMDVAALRPADRGGCRGRRRAAAGGGTAGSVSTGAVTAAGYRGRMQGARRVVSRGWRYGASPQRCRRSRRPVRASASRIRWPSIRKVALCATRGRIAARARSGAPARAPSPITRRTITSTSARRTTSTYGPQNSRGFRALKVWLALSRPAPRLPRDDHDDIRCRGRWPRRLMGTRSWSWPHRRSASRRSAMCRAIFERTSESRRPRHI